jgi:hypothetical protein
MDTSVSDACIALKKRVHFEFESSPFSSDRLVQGVRMALSLAMDAEVSLLYRGASVHVAGSDIRYRHVARDVHDHERFLVEMEIPIHVLAREWEAMRRQGIALRAGVSELTEAQADSLRARADVVFNL